MFVEVSGFLGKFGCRDFFRSYVCDDFIMGNEEKRRGVKLRYCVESFVLRK